MADFRLVAARIMAWNKEAWREPARLGLVIRAMQQIVDNDAESEASRVEAEMLLKKLRLVGKEPRLAPGIS